MQFLYNLGVRFFGFAILIASLFNDKARKWRLGRKNWRQKIQDTVSEKDEYIWMHCSSLGEFEQGRPILDVLAKNGEKVILSFFSPSGYENLKNYKEAFHVCYLPLDTASNAKDWIEIVKPKAVLFVKYEFWFNFIQQTNKGNIPIFLISGIFRKEHYFFKLHGKWAAKQLKKFTHFFVQDESSKNLLESIDIKQVSVSGDSRFDRVYEIAQKPKKIEIAEAFCKDSFSIVAGSTWKEDESKLLKLLGDFPELKLIIAPHELSPEHLKDLRNNTSQSGSFYSDQKSSDADRVLVVDTIGLLSSLYQYGDVCYVGGGFGNGIHNTLEAAVYGKPIVFGPKFQKFKEARDMINLKSAFSYQDYNSLKSIISGLSNENVRYELGQKNKEFVEENRGASKMVLTELQKTGIIKSF